MPVKNNGRTIKDFFKPFTIPKSRRPTEEEDEIVVASSPRKVQTTQPNNGKGELQQNSPTPKRRPGRPRKDATASPTPLRLSQARSGSATPTRKSPRKHVNGAVDSSVTSSGLASLHSSQESTRTRTRRLQAVELPSPMKSTSSPPPRAPPASSQPPKNINTSFSSLSTLSSAPPFSSQSSSRRIIKDGVPAVTNSDSASMSSSDDELMEIDALIPRKKRKVTPPAPAVPSRGTAAEQSNTAKPSRTSMRLSDDNKKKRESWKPPSPPPTTVTYKHSLLKMVKQNERQTATEAKIAEAEAMMREAELKREIDERRAAEQETDGKSLAAAAFAGDRDEGERMMMAMERTEALRGEVAFFFFRGDVSEHLGESAQLPSKDLDAHGLSFLKDPARRRLAVTSGFLATVASQRGLPGFVVKWVQHCLLTEESEELCEAYVAILDAVVSSPFEVSEPIFSPSELYTGQTLRDVEETGRHNQGEVQRLPLNLKYALKAMAALAPTISTDDQACALAELVLLNIDDNVRKDLELQICVERAMSAILESDNEEKFASVCQETIRQILHASILSRNFLARTATFLPASSLRLHQLRRRLALHILLDAPADDTIDMTSQDTSIRLITQLRKHPDYHITENTNYTTLLSLTELIDIAIDNGFSTFQPSNPPTPTTEQATKTLFSHHTPTISPEEASFNAQIDSLATQLRLIASTIRDAGTSHLKRTEAKSALERLIVRLESAVRTRARPRRGMFGMGGAGGSSKAMGAFLKKAEMGGRRKERRVGFAEPERGDEGLGGGDVAVIDENRLVDQADGNDKLVEERDAKAGASENAQH